MTPDTRISECITGLLEILENGPCSLQAIVDCLTRALKADRGMLVSCAEQSSQVRILAACNVQEPNLTVEEFQISRTVFRQVLRFRQSVLVRDPLDDPAFGAQSSIVKAQIRSVLAVPIFGRTAVTGILYFDTLRPTGGLTDKDLVCAEKIRPLVKHLSSSQFPESPELPRGGEVFLDRERALHGLTGQDPAFLEALALLRKVAPTPATVLLTGESGTGKELFARALHVLSPRTKGPFVAVNCAAIPDSLLENELFGHEKAAFTGADTARAGKVEQAHHGTLFLDEVGELKQELQAKLLRFVQSHEVERIGGRAPIAVDVRVIAATNQDLAARVSEGAFRQDLFFRLNVFPIVLPPLRLRRSDIRLLTRHFMEKYAALLDLRDVSMAPEVFALLETYQFPGNIRELENIVYRALLLSREGNVGVGDLPAEVHAGMRRDMDKNPYGHLLSSVPASYEELGRRREEMKQICRTEIAFLERSFAEGLVSAAGGNVSKAAEIAGIDRGLFYRLLKP